VAETLAARCVCAAFGVFADGTCLALGSGPLPVAQREDTKMSRQARAAAGRNTTKKTNE
jgi:hypothetical protein